MRTSFPPLFPADPQLQMRLAAAADSELLARLVNSAYRGETSRTGWTTEADLLDGQRTDVAAIRRIVGSPDQVMLVVEATELLGCVHLTKERDGKAHLGMLTVAPHRQAGGIGRWLLESAEEYARKEWQATLMEMSVITVRSELLSWYERRGYRRTGRQIPFPSSDPSFGIPRAGILEFEVLQKSLAVSSSVPEERRDAT